MNIAVSYEPSFEVIKVKVLTKYQRECRCKNAGEDDGSTTCWEHHDCRDGSCTHIDEDY